MSFSTEIDHFFRRYATKQDHLNNLQVLSTRKKASSRITRSSRIFKTIINAIHEKKGENIDQPGSPKNTGGGG